MFIVRYSSPTADNRQDDGARDDATWIAHLAAEITHVVVAPVVVQRDQERGAEPREERVRRLPRALREGERLRRAEVRQAREDDRERRGDDADPEERAEPADDRDAAVEQEHGRRDGRHRQERAVRDGEFNGRRADAWNGQRNPLRGDRVVQRRPEVLRVLREPDAARGHRQRGAERQLEDEQERQPAADTWTVHGAQVLDRPARAGQGGAEFRPHQPVAHGEQRAEHPADHGLRPVHRGDDERDRDERPHADHVDHVQRGGVPEADSPNQPGIVGGGRRHRDKFYSAVHRRRPSQVTVAVSRSWRCLDLPLNT